MLTESGACQIYNWQTFDRLFLGDKLIKQYFEGKFQQEMLHILTIAVRQVIHVYYIHNLK